MVARLCRFGTDEAVIAYSDFGQSCTAKEHCEGALRRSELQRKGYLS
jgi:hypothetical protein